MKNEISNRPNVLGQFLLRQFQGSWRMLRAAIESVPEEQWHDGKDQWLFSWTVYHIIETADYYSRSYKEGMKWGKVADIDWENDREEEIEEKQKKVTKELVLAYLAEIEPIIERDLKETTDEDFLKKDGFSWFHSKYEKLIYLLRHSTHHIGELAKTLRDWDCERIKWD
ncbi:MAG: DinB family protein [Candidatus Heimdallarchaeaceae archaeon]